MARRDLQPQQKGVFGQRKLDKEAVRAHVRDHPDAILRECAANLSHIEPDFANIKKRRQYAPPGTPLSDIVRCYGN